ncbi:MAG: aminotransferase class V-fold PLP-dependent enzyme [Halobacteriales archaeon]
MTNDTTIYSEFNVPTVINAVGTKTRVGGPRMRPEAADAMRAAARSGAHISELQAKASERISEATGAEAGYVTTGASAALTLATAACIAGDDLGRMARLPKTGDAPNEIVLPRSQRNCYDRAFHVGGGTIVEIGNNDHTLGVAATNVHPWEIEDAISDRTAAIAHLPKQATQLPLEMVVEIAHDNDVPVIVDGAATLPPKENLRRYIDAGADLVAFSGGKAIRGPQATGILAGRADLIRSVACQQLDWDVTDTVWDPPESLFGDTSPTGIPRLGIGRGFKVGTEELVGLLRALECYLEEDEQELHETLLDRAMMICEGVTGISGVEASVTPDIESEVSAANHRSEVIPEVVLKIDPDATGLDAVALAEGLREERPRIVLGADRALDGQLSINPFSLSDEEARYVIDQIRGQLTDR